MNRLILLSVIIAGLALSCISDPAITERPEGDDWKLIEVRINNINTGFDRTALVGNYSEFFTINIDDKQIFGVGAPNRYSAPYTVSKENPLAVEIAVVRSTLMASIYQHDKLREHDFFNYLQNTYKWGFSGGNLALYSKAQNGADVLLVFSK